MQLLEEVVVPVPKIIPFQYNPEKLQRSIAPFDPPQPDPTQQGEQAPTSQPSEPKESITISIELDATDDLEEGKTKAQLFGVADRISAIEQLLYSNSGLLGAALERLSALGVKVVADRKTVPIVLLVWGPGRVVPVRISSYAVEETFFNPQLEPLHATISLGMDILTPDQLKVGDQSTIALEIANAAYNGYRARKQTLSALDVGNIADAISSLIPV